VKLLLALTVVAIVLIGVKIYIDWKREIDMETLWAQMSNLGKRALALRSGPEFQATMRQLADLFEQYLQARPPEERREKFAIMTPYGSVVVVPEELPQRFRQATELTWDLEAILKVLFT